MSVFLYLWAKKQSKSSFFVLFWWFSSEMLHDEIWLEAAVLGPFFEQPIEMTLWRKAKVVTDGA